MEIDPKSREFLEKKYSQELKEDVDITVFTRDIITSGENPEYAQFCKELVKELSQINSKIKAEYLSLQDERAKKLDVSLSPTIAIGYNSGYSVQYWGVPAGQIAATLIETISLVSQRKSGLDESTREKLKNIDKDLLIETYFSLDSPVSGQAVLLSNRIAIERPDRIRSRSIETQEAAQRAKTFNISALPSVLINENQDSLISGSVSEEKLIYQLILDGASDKDAILAKLEEEEKKKKILADNPDYPVVLTTSNFDEAIKKYPSLVIDCWAEWCAPCHMVHPVIENLAKKYKGEIAFGKLNIDENREIAERFRIMSIPTLLVFMNGQNVDSIVGAMPQNVLEEKIRDYLKIERS
jgi:thioredoxin 1